MVSDYVMTKKSYEAEQPREVYPNQELVEEKIRTHLLEGALNYLFVDEVRLMGSLAFGHFGVFYEPEMKNPEKPKLASDVDLLIIGDENYPIPKEWKKEHPFIFFDVYKLGTLQGIESINDDVHEVDAWVYFPSQANEEPRLSEERLKKMEAEKDPRLEFKTRKEWLDWQLREHPSELWYKK